MAFKPAVSSTHHKNDGMILVQGILLGHTHHFPLQPPGFEPLVEGKNTLTPALTTSLYRRIALLHQAHWSVDQTGNNFPGSGEQSKGCAACGKKQVFSNPGKPYLVYLIKTINRSTKQELT